ncbi:gamma subclass chorismate mutase AroQ [Curtobacterium sp. Csp1]|uniref:gamma subclass chorismate mutase AroQ n=1 Tax=unclassified Curtobacterium TaxID=257496 RepID=UPI001597AF74|nr:MULTISPECIES: gamma subclass chorismate mutase AroQ [unclassified Curtobacterium]QKS14278.1 gamma subclass chorismate mutase AroQ [Curtobacterium sp. csp3]QKS21413.1 gamma subclass chorismate mutase AroQ [Curtobacterium sp. Csp1]
MTTAVLLSLIATVVGSGLVAARPAIAAPTTSDTTTTAGTDTGRLSGVGDLVVSRLALAEPVAESKWLSGKPIADPAREQAVVDAGVARARAEGVDPDLVTRVLRDQIAASKLVQRGLFTRWTHEPWSAPTTAPDLTAVRTQITQIDDDLVDRLAAVAPIAAAPRCAHAVDAERHRVESGLDSLQRKGLHVAWSSFCND